MYLEMFFMNWFVNVNIFVIEEGIFMVGCGIFDYNIFKKLVIF